MIKFFLFSLLMASLMFSIQISFVGCEDNGDNDFEDQKVQIEQEEQFTSSNEYLVKARIVGVDFGGIISCADIIITKNGYVIEDALIMVNSDTVEYSLGAYQTTLTTDSTYDLSITHEGNLIALGSGVQIPNSIPEITNIDS